MSVVVRTRRAGAAAVLGTVAALLPPALAAHDVWLAPATYRPAAGELLAVRLIEGHGGGEIRPVPRNDALVERFEITPSDGGLDADAVPVVGLDGGEPAGLVRPLRPGLHTIIYRGRARLHRLPAAKFERYLEEEGLEAARARRAAAGASDAPVVESYSRSLRALVAVAGSGAGADRPTGLALELVAETNPYRATVGDTLVLRALARGEPVANLLVEARPLDHPGPPLARRSATDGRVEVPLTHSGPWLVTAVHLTPTRDAGADWESTWTALTFALAGD